MYLIIEIMKLFDRRNHIFCVTYTNSVKVVIKVKATFMNSRFFCSTNYLPAKKLEYYG
jgi:hypothetical protein